MGPSLKPHKTRITKLANTLEEMIESSQHMVAFEVPIMENEEESMDLLRTRIKSIQHRHTNITTTKAALETAVSSYQEAFNSLDNNSQQEERTSQETYVDRAWDLTATALSLLNKLDEKETELSSRLDNFAQAARRRERQLETVNTPQASNESSRWTTPPPSQLQSLLPRLQLPKFSGRRGEWGSFWAIFQVTVDEQPIPTMIKFNYLLQSLVGEARQTAAQFQVVEASYQLVIEALKKKYGEDASIIEDLLMQLETTKAEGLSTKLQANLLERITAILTQLAAKGQDVNQRLVLNLVLRKFSAEIQAKAFERRERLTDSQQWTWSVLQKDLQDIITTKERIERSQELITKPHTPLSPLRGESQERRPIPACIYCKRSNHRSVECRTVPISERAAFLARNQLCTNCGRPNHTAQNCRSQGCFRCGLKHHSSTCRRLLPPPNHEQSTGTTTKPQQINQPARIVPTPNVARMQQRGTTQATHRQTTQNLVTIEEDRKKKKPVTKTASTTLQTSCEDNELDIYDNYWKMESTGIEEYTGTEKEAKKIQEDQILKKFKETIVRKPDGYYVRLPWKEPHEYLPDNRSIALARLKSLLRQYEDRKEFLQEFDNIFKDQFQKGIIEVVEDKAGKPRPKGQIIHYLAHQAVKTINIKTVYLLSDSEIALSWLKNESPQKTTGVLVTNRIKEIKKIAKKLEQEGVNTYFGYINTKVNPADCATRGLTAEELQNHIWWDGPPTSLTDENAIYEGLERFQLTPDPAEVLQISNASHPLIHVERFSSLRRLKRTVAYVGIFLNKLAKNLPEESKQKIRRASGIQEATDKLQGADLMQAERTIIKLHQKEHEALITANEQRKLNITRDDKGTENPNQIRQVELRMPNGKVTKRPVNSLIPLELLDSDPGHEQLSTHEHPSAPTQPELPSEPSPETPRRPKRSPSRYYPYSLEEYEINSITTDEKSITQPNTYIFRMQEQGQGYESLDSFLQTLNQRRSMFNEKELQRRLDIVYEETTKLMAQGQQIVTKATDLKNEAANYEPVPEKSKPLYDRKNELLASIHLLKQRWEHVHVVSILLWDAYDMLVHLNPPTFFNRVAFEQRPRPRGHYTKDDSITTIREEQHQLNGLQAQLEILTIDPFLNPYIDSDEKKPYISEVSDADIHAKLDNIEKLIQKRIDDTSITKRSPDTESMLRKLHRIETILIEDKARRTEDTLSQQLVQLTELLQQTSTNLENKINNNTELIVNSIINLLTQVSELLRTGHQPKSPDRHRHNSSSPVARRQKPRRSRSRQPAKRPPRDPELALLHRKLDHLAQCEKRLYGLDAPQPSTPHKCTFCFAIHNEDACVAFKTVEERRAVVRSRNLCIHCLGNSCVKPCPDRIACNYCKSKSHHYALCPLPEERSALEEQIAMYHH
ncbi:unnamed protein product [Cylicocyclus nassatus]|uniref:CCHC-type domain-containing protein n=1 Tax=Cylicocyclus nassatus TaxID=53992 RepID=A0AA36HCS9_CYLNA|nr:unnamed protein product [Cylicocyclus nassatus]